MSLFDKASSFFAPGKVGSVVHVGACPGRHEERDGEPFSPNGQSGQRLRVSYPEFDQSTRVNVNPKPRYAPGDNTTQPTVRECIENVPYTSALRTEIESRKSEGSRVITHGKVAAEVLKKLDIAVDEARPHPSGRNRSYKAPE